MKIFKKEKSKVTKSNIEKMEKNQLEKVIGGADSGTNTSIDTITPTTTTNKQTQGLSFGEAV